MTGMATTARRAAERGQSMLFGGLKSAEEALIVLPKQVREIPRKRLLQDEKEMLGTYVSVHPLQAQLDALQQQITHTSATLTEGDNGQKVVIAGIGVVVGCYGIGCGHDRSLGHLL